MITVAGLDTHGMEAGFSNVDSLHATAQSMDMAAPAVAVPVGYGPDGSPVLRDGTSFAAPQVTAAAALLLSVDPVPGASGTGWRSPTPGTRRS